MFKLFIYMHNIRRFIKEIVSEIVISEQAKMFFNIDPNTGLIISKDSSDQKWLNLFDFKANKCVGIITLRKFSDRTWGVTTVAADKGLGPLMYEFGMMSVYPAGICVDKIGSTSEAAFSVWKKFADNRGDIRKVIIKPEDIEYSSNYEDDTKSFLENVIFLKTPSIWLKKITDRGEMLMKKHELIPEEISDICRDYFKKRYQER